MSGKFTVTCEYYATGEGMTRMLFYTMAPDRDEALNQFADRFGHFYVLGCEVEEGYNLDHKLAKLLLTEAARTMLTSEGYVTYAAELHANYS